MSASRIRLSTRETGSVMLDVGIVGGAPGVRYARSHGLREMAEDWIERGLSELVPDADGYPSYRLTVSSDPAFVQRVGEYLEKQSGGRVEFFEE